MGTLRDGAFFACQESTNGLQMIRRCAKAFGKLLPTPAQVGTRTASLPAQSEAALADCKGLHKGWSTSWTQTKGYAARSNDVGLKRYKPVTPGLRHRVITTRENLWRYGPLKALTTRIARSGGRNNTGRITAWHRGGGHKKLYRVVDFKRSNTSAAGTVERLEYDPNRSARIALVRHFPVGEEPKNLANKDKFSYFLAPQSVRAGDYLQNGPEVPLKPGNTLPLTSIPLGSVIHNVELIPGRGGQLARSAGTSCTLISRERGEKPYAVVKMPSGEQRRVLAACQATMGVLSNPQHRNRKLGKAGAKRWLGRRPVTRGVAMNPVDHPHGGGRGKSKGRISQTPWGVPTKGFKTRKKKNRTDQFIHLSRHKLKSRVRK